MVVEGPAFRPAISGPHSTGNALIERRAGRDLKRRVPRVDAQDAARSVHHGDVRRQSEAEPLGIALILMERWRARRRVSDSAAWRCWLFAVAPSGSGGYGTGSFTLASHRAGCWTWDTILREDGWSSPVALRRSLGRASARRLRSVACRSRLTTPVPLAKASPVSSSRPSAPSRGKERRLVHVAADPLQCGVNVIVRGRADHLVDAARTKAVIKGCGRSILDRSWGTNSVPM